MDNDITYFPEMCDLVTDMMEMGAVIDDVLTVFKINRDTFDNWRQYRPEFDEAVKEGLEMSKNWWMMEMRCNLNNPDFDADKARQVMTQHFGWEE